MTGIAAFEPGPRPSSAYYYKYASAEYLDRLEALLSTHHIYMPTVDQLNDPAKGKPKLARASLDALTGFYNRSIIDRHGGAEPAIVAQLFAATFCRFLY